MADPFSNGNDVNANDSMRKTLNRYDNELDYAYEKWKIRVNQLINEDLEDNKPKQTYFDKWIEGKKNLRFAAIVLKGLTDTPVGSAAKDSSSDVSPIMKYYKIFQLQN